MKEIKFNNKEYNIPESWSEVTVGMLIKASELSELLDDAPIIAIISAYTNIPVKDIKVSNSKEVNEILNIMSFTSNLYEPIPETEFLFKGETYGCSEDLTEQRFEDFVSIQTALFNHRDEPARALPKLIAIYCKKKGETLDDFNLNERAKLFEELPMTTAKNIEGFFLHSINAYKSILLLSSTQDIQKDIVLHRLQELKNTVKASKVRTGIFSHTRWQIGLFQIYLWLWGKQLVRYFNLQHTKPSKKIYQVIWKKLQSMIKNVNKSN